MCDARLVWAARSDYFRPAHARFSGRRSRRGENDRHLPFLHQHGHVRRRKVKVSRGRRLGFALVARVVTPAAEAMAATVQPLLLGQWSTVLRQLLSLVARIAAGFPFGYRVKNQLLNRQKTPVRAN